MTKCSSLSNTKNRWRGVSHRHATIANTLNKTWSATPTFSIFKRWSCSAKYIVIDCKKCNFAIIKDIFECRKRSFAVFKNLESRLPGYMNVRANSVSSLTWTPFVFFVCWIYYCLLHVCRISFSFFFFLTTCPSESFYAFLETRRFQWTHWQIIASSCDFHSCTEGSEELAHMQYRKGLLQQYRHKVETHPVSKIGPLSAYWRRR